jgi:hypothetical protein
MNHDPSVRTGNAALPCIATLFCGVLAVASCASQSEPKVPREQRLDKLHARAEVVATELAALGFPVRRSEVTLTLGEAHRDWRDLGLSTEDEETEKWLDKGKGVSRNIIAFYDPDGHRVVFRERTEKLLENPDWTVAHELVHAYQDQSQGGLDRRFPLFGTTTDRRRCLQALSEGEATLVADTVMLARQGRDLGTLDLSLEPNYVGVQAQAEDVGSPYTAGRRFLLDRYRSGGWAAVRHAYAHPPESSEQLLNPAKFEHDRPRLVTLPEWPDPAAPVALQYQTTWGEMALSEELAGLLWDEDDIAMQGPRDARAATLGWDGDRTVAYDLDGQEARLSRSVWDLEENATNYAQALQRALKKYEHRVNRFRLFGKTEVVSKYDIQVRGHVVDVVYSEEPELLPILQGALASHLFEFQPDEGDMQSTRDAMAAFERSAQPLPFVDKEERWLHPRSGVAVPLPDGWEVKLGAQGTQYLQGRNRGDYRPLATVSLHQDLVGGDVVRYAEQLRADITQSSLPILQSSVIRLTVGQSPAARLSLLVSEPDSDEVEVLYWFVARQGHIFEMQLFHEPAHTAWVPQFFDTHLATFNPAAPGASSAPSAPQAPPASGQQPVATQ